MRHSEYDQMAQDFLRKANAQIKIVFVRKVEGFPFSNDKLPHNKYQVILSRNGKVYDFPFYGSFRDYQKGLRPTTYDILACVEKYEPPSTMWDFAREFGYEVNSEEAYDRVSRIYQECKDQYRSLLDLFGEDLMNDLREIS